MTTPTPDGPQRVEGLLERLRAATGPDRELDEALCDALIPLEQHGQFYRFYGGQSSDGYYDYPTYTASLDAALALVERVLPGRQWQVNRKSDGSAFAVVETGEPGNRFERQDAPTAPLAVLIALLSALTPRNQDQ